MRIGIITFHRALNYGAVLQSYALQQFLNDLGVESEIIDYRAPYIENFYKPIKANPVKQPKVYLKEFVYSFKNRTKRRKFQDFINAHLKLSRTVYNSLQLQEIANEYDMLVAGSDQVWNNKWTGFDKSYFLDFCPDSKKYSYAASFGFDEIPREIKAEYKQLLQGFQKLSLRESSGRTIVRDLLGREDAVTAIDPTCLLDCRHWSDVATEPDDKGYVLVYLLEKSEKLVSYAQEIAREKNTKVIYIADALKKTIQARYEGFMSPSDFVGLFKNAGYIVTNSFHGLMFSVIFKKQFYLQYQQRQGAPNARLVDFIREFGLEKRVIDKDTRFFEEEIDYESISGKMQEKKQEAKEFFYSAFERVSKKCF